MKKIKLIFGVHNHQPVGNFDWVFQKAYDNAYKPFLDVILKHKNIKWNLHASGILWDFLLSKKSYVSNIKKLVAKGSLEILSGGYYEPILSVIPQKDRIGQINKLSQFIKNTFNYNPAGAWIAERVWEPSLVKDLTDTGIKYVALDDVHFSSSGLDINDLKGYYATEDQGAPLNVFPISQKLRYFVPFKDVNLCIDYFRYIANNENDTVIVMADDGEKFGIWPGTYKHVYENGWLDKFLTALEENSDIVETVTFSEVLNTIKPQDRIYLQTGSYFEMSEWSLPGSVQNIYDDFVKQNENNDKFKPFIKGGFWRSFFTKYDESNNMHKKMIRTSGKINSLIEKGMSSSGLSDALYAGQCNCAYWHGVFGGLYLPHLRNAIYEHLLKAENIYNESAQINPLWHKSDFDCDGCDEFLYESKIQNIYVRQTGGTIFEFDILKKNYNLSNVLTRRYEGYHKKLKDAIYNNKVSDSQELASIHSDVVKVKELGLENHLNYDWYARTSLRDHFFHNDTSYNDIYPVKFREQGDFVLGNYEISVKTDRLELSRNGNVWINDTKAKIQINKSIIPLKKEGYEVRYEIKNLESKDLNFMFAVEHVFSFSQKTLDDSAQSDNALSWQRNDENLAIEVKVSSSKKCSFWTVPIETVSTSEDGYEKTYQGTALFNVYRFSLKPRDEFNFVLTVSVKNGEKK
jgi:alpha-amylase/alpha-mannosidase (GH57 family)